MRSYARLSNIWVGKGGLLAANSGNVAEFVLDHPQLICGVRTVEAQPIHMMLGWPHSSVVMKVLLIAVDHLLEGFMSRLREWILGDQRGQFRGQSRTYSALVIEIPLV